MIKFILPLFILFSLSPALADCKDQLMNIIESAEHVINTSSLDPRCKKLGLIGGKQNCIQATVGTIWDLKALMEPILKRARRLCNQPLCSPNKSLCSGLLENERHLINVGIYGLLEDIDGAAWRTRATPK